MRRASLFFEVGNAKVTDCPGNYRRVLEPTQNSGRNYEDSSK